MAEEIKKLSYKEALKALKEQYAEERKQERLAKKAEARKEKREEACGACRKALKELEAVDPAFNRELSSVVIRLNMFIEGKRYTRNMNKGGDK